MTSSSTEEALDQEAGNASFMGDTADLPIETRRVLVQLLLGPALDAQRQTKLWPVLLRDEAIVRVRLHELFLDLVVDLDQQVAFTRQVVDSEIDIPILLRKSTLTFLQSALLLYLREQLIVADARGERAVTSRDVMVEHLGVFDRDKNADQAKFRRQAESAIDRAVQLNLIRKLRGGEERYEVSPTLKLLFSAEEIQALTRTFELAARRGSCDVSAGEVESMEEPS
jgi:Domain of unknown function (DUF4194)